MTTTIEIRPLDEAELSLYCEHLLRLDDNARWMRFNHIMDDAALLAHCLYLASSGTMLIGAFVDDTLRGAAELSLSSDHNVPIVEMAFSVESKMQGRGIGSSLLKTALTTIWPAPALVVCRTDNIAMRHLAERAGGQCDPAGDLMFYRIETLYAIQGKTQAEPRTKTGEKRANRKPAYGYV